MQVALLIAVSLLATPVLANAGSAFTAEELKKKYDAIQRERADKYDQEAGLIKTQVKYLHHHKPTAVPESMRQSVSNSYIECVPGKLNSNAVYDFPLKVGWLYSSFGEDSNTTKKYFDSSASEYWAFPNFSCNFNNVLAAVSWMRSGRKAGYKENKGLHSKFKDHRPPFYAGEKFFAHNRSGGIYCDWDGWLYPSSNIDYEYFIDTSRGNELFTLMNVYCHKHSYVRMFYTAQASRDQQLQNNTHPFNGIDPPAKSTDNTYPSVLCNWKGWLYGDTSGDKWVDSKGNNRYGYEKYFAIDTKSIGDNGKDWITGRVANPFCAKNPNSRYGLVTAVRAFCFFPIRARSEDAIQRLQEKHCQGL